MHFCGEGFNEGVEYLDVSNHGLSVKNAMHKWTQQLARKIGRKNTLVD